MAHGTEIDLTDALAAGWPQAAQRPLGLEQHRLRNMDIFPDEELSRPWALLRVIPVLTSVVRQVRMTYRESAPYLELSATLVRRAPLHPAALASAA